MIRVYSPIKSQRTRFLGGLLLACLLVLLPFSVPAQIPDMDQAVSVQLEPANPEIGQPLVIRLLVNHGDPKEVQVFPPEFPPSLQLDSIRTETRVMDAQPGSPLSRENLARWTQVEYRLIPLAGGRQRLGSFTVLTPRMRVATQELQVEVRQGGTSPLRLVWEQAPPFLLVGEARTMTLYLEGSPPLGSSASRREALEPWELYRDSAPRNGIIEIVPAQPPEEQGGRHPLLEQPPDSLERAPPLGLTPLLEFRIIPLEGDRIALPPATMAYNSQVLAIPALEIPVRPSPSGAISAPILPAPAPVAASPKPPAELLERGGLFGALVSRPVAAANQLLRQGQSEEALAVLRRGERDLLFGPALRPLRQNLEQRLNLDGQEGEKWRPTALFGGGALLLLLLAGGFQFLGSIPSKQQKGGSTARRRHRWALILLLCLALGNAWAFFRSIGSSAAPLKGRSAVLRSTVAYRIPDASGEEAWNFSSGETAIIRTISGSWVFIESFDGRSGWIGADYIIPY